MKEPLKKNMLEQYACGQMNAAHLQLMHPIISCKDYIQKGKFCYNINKKKSFL